MDGKTPEKRLFSEEGIKIIRNDDRIQNKHMNTT